MNDKELCADYRCDGECTITDVPNSEWEGMENKCQIKIVCDKCGKIEYRYVLKINNINPQSSQEIIKWRMKKKYIK